jgi:hypothetical protein
MQVIEAQCASILEPHDHLHISQSRMLARGVGHCLPAADQSLSARHRRPWHGVLPVPG